MVYELLNALYGIKESPLLQYLTLLKILKKLSFKPLIQDKYVFTRSTSKNIVIIIVYVNDFIVVAPTKQQAQVVLTELSGYFQLKELGNIYYFLGYYIVRNRKKRAIYIIQDVYVKKTIKVYSFKGVASLSTPLPSKKLTNFTGIANKGDIKRY